jgi:two-component system, NarL family, nitrate/nitrite response regulator NarL
VPTQTLLVSDSPIGAEALQLILDTDGRVRIVAVTDAETAVSCAQSVAHQIVLIDLPVPHGPLLARTLLLCDPNSRIVASSVIEDESNVLAWARVGILGCVGQSSSLTELVAVIDAAAQRERSCSGLVGRSLFDAATRFAVHPNVDRGLNLTAREAEILQLLAYDWSNKQIARALRIALPTVKNHLHSAFQKLGVHNRWEARRHFLVQQ